MRHVGRIICSERLRRGWSQEGLCHGICAVSYLSKIETGKADPSPEIKRLLLQRLGMDADPAREAEAIVWKEKAYDLLLSGREKALQKILPLELAHDLRATEAGLDLLLLSRIAWGGSPMAAELEPLMEDRQLALQRLLQGRFSEAVRLLPAAFCRYWAGCAAYERGEYTAATEYLTAAYDQAAAEGAARLMLRSRFLLGNVFCNRMDRERMLLHYGVARRLAIDLGETTVLKGIEYNTAASDLETGRYEQAYAFFSALPDPSLMALHKLAICCEKTDRPAEAFAALERAESMSADEVPQVLARQMLWLVRFRLEHEDHLDLPAYGAMLLDCFDRCRRELPDGYARFHLPWVLKWYAHTRQYKKAYALLKEFPENAR